MYKVIVRFADIQDNYTIYNPGDTFPRNGLKVSAARLEELLSPANRRGKALIQYIPEEQPKKPEKAPEKKTATNTITKVKKAKDGANTTEEKPKRGRKKKDAE